MIGIVVQGTSKYKSDFDSIVYHKFSTGLSAVETTLRNAMDSALAHRVVLSMPVSERRFVQKLNTKGKFPRIATVHHYDESTEDTLDALYFAAAQHAFDHIVRLHANSPLIPSWLINECIADYMRRGVNSLYKNYQGEELSGPGFEIEIMPFWWLADKYINEESYRNNSILNDKMFVRPSPELGVIKTDGHPFLLSGTDVVEPIESIIETVLNGYDTQDVITEYINGHKQETAEEQ